MGAISVLFRTDTGPQIGLGHLQPRLSLATALRETRAACIFLIDADDGGQNRITSLGFEMQRLDSIEIRRAGDLGNTLAVAAFYRCDAVVVDSYEINAEYLSCPRASGLFVVVIDDLARQAFPCQLVVNGGAHAQQLPYCSSSGETQFRLDPQFAVLRPELWDVPPRTVRDTVQNILVTLGGAEPHNLLPRLLSLLDNLLGNFTVTAIVGPCFGNRAGVERVAGLFGAKNAFA